MRDNGFILKEIRVLEVHFYSSGFTKGAHSTAAASHTAVGKAGHREKRESVCTYCKGSHTANQCTVIKDQLQHAAIAKTAGLCYNCLAHDKVSQCTSHRRCKDCNQKRHASLCPSPPVVAPTNNPTPVLNSVQPPSTLKPNNVQPPPALTPNNVQPCQLQ